MQLHDARMCAQVVMLGIYNSLGTFLSTWGMIYQSASELKHQNQMKSLKNGLKIIYI